jgi:type III secretory pathway component EscU
MIRDVMRTAVTMEQVSKHDSEEMNTRNNRRVVFSVRSVPRVCKKTKKIILVSSVSSRQPARN